MPIPDTVVVAIPTYRRNAALAALLPQVTGQLRDSGHPGAVVVVDNDPAAGAAATVTGHPGVRYCHEPEPGIAAARNRALREAGAAGLLVFIDDDETPAPGWLAGLLATRRRFGATAVAGPVISTFTRPSPDFVTAGRYFQRLRWPTGTIVATAATNNLLLDLRFVRDHALSFDARFGLTGGSDTLFCNQLIAAGGVIRWCDDAVVYDPVPPHRNTSAWVTRRAFRIGNAASRVAVVQTPPGAARLARRLAATGRGAARVAGGSARYGWGLVSGDLGHRARGARTLLRGAGMAAGAWNLTYTEYGRPAAAAGSSGSLPA